MIYVVPLSQSSYHLYGTPSTLYATRSRAGRVLVEQSVSGQSSNLTFHPEVRRSDLAQDDIVKAADKQAIPNNP